MSLARNWNQYKRIKVRDRSKSSSGWLPIIFWLCIVGLMTADETAEKGAESVSVKETGRSGRKRKSPKHLPNIFMAVFFLALSWLISTSAGYHRLPLFAYESGCGEAFHWQITFELHFVSQLLCQRSPTCLVFGLSVFGAMDLAQGYGNLTFSIKIC